jgi:hypothetical protein
MLQGMMVALLLVLVALEQLGTVLTTLGVVVVRPVVVKVHLLLVV